MTAALSTAPFAYEVAAEPGRRPKAAVPLDKLPGDIAHLVRESPDQAAAHGQRKPRRTAVPHCANALMPHEDPLSYIAMFVDLTRGEQERRMSELDGRRFQEEAAPGRATTRKRHSRRHDRGYRFGAPVLARDTVVALRGQPKGDEDAQESNSCTKRAAG